MDRIRLRLRLKPSIAPLGQDDIQVRAADQEVLTDVTGPVLLWHVGVGGRNLGSAGGHSDRRRGRRYACDARRIADPLVELLAGCSSVGVDVDHMAGDVAANAAAAVDARRVLRRRRSQLRIERRSTFFSVLRFAPKNKQAIKCSSCPYRSRSLRRTWGMAVFGCRMGSNQRNHRGY